MKKLLIATVVLLSSITAMAQVTTSTITGKVTDNREDIIGATIKATHQPSGTVYYAVSNVDGLYSIPAMKAGGPYEVEVSYIGYQTKKFTDIQLELGQTMMLNVVINENAQQLKEVQVIAPTRNTMRSDRSGPVTNLNAEAMATIPTVGRQLTDYMKMIPQSSSSTGFAVGGGNFRQSNITVDGASFNDNFGLGAASPLPGGGAPIALDAIEQVAISVAPFDVRQSGFTGGSINAVTRSGTNEFKGTAYTYLTSSSLRGARVGDSSLAIDKSRNNIYGISFGGPILKDKLFFFVNGEYEDDVVAASSARAGNGTTPYTESNRRPQLNELESMSAYLRSKYGIETGSWQAYNIKSPAYRLLARIDWNINQNHKFNIRFTHSNRKESKPSSISRSLSGVNVQKDLYGGSAAEYGSFSNYSMSSLSSRYILEYRFTSLAAELNSRFGLWNNTLRFTYSFQDQPRSNEYGVSTPVIEVIMDNGSGKIFPSWAMTGDIYTYGNLTQTKNTVITDEVSATLGNHQFLAGLQYEHDSAANGYAHAGAGYYAFKATAAQVSNGDWDNVFSTPHLFVVTYGNNPTRSDFKSKMKTDRWSLYLQDNVSFSERFRLSAGVRFELPHYPSLKNNYNEAFYKIDFGGEHFRTDNVPGNSISVSPRLGFNWDITGSRKYILRGGTGLFVGRLPFVWLISAVGNSGLGQTTYAATATNGKAKPTLTTNKEDMLNQINAKGESSVPSGPIILANDLRMPKTWKSSLAFDVKLPYDIDFTVEGVYSKDLNPVVVSNRDIYWDGTSTIDLGHGDVRHKLSYYDAGSSAYVLENAGKRAYYASLSFQLHKKFDFGLDLAASYTLSRAKCYSEGIGDQPSSAYKNYRPSVNASNDNETGYASYVAPNRLLISASYKLKETKNATSTFSLIYDGYQSGYLSDLAFNRFSYTFASNVLGDPTAPGNLIYVPASREELDSWNFVNNGTVNGQVYTADMQRDDFWEYICQDDYLKNRKGQYAERGGAKMPWHHQLDFKYLRDMRIKLGKYTHALQLGIDILNLPNFLCKDWGVTKQVAGNSLLTYRNNQYSYNTINGERHRSTFQTLATEKSTYQIMFTIRYLFN